MHTCERENKTDGQSKSGQVHVRKADEWGWGGGRQREKGRESVDRKIDSRAARKGMCIHIHMYICIHIYIYIYYKYILRESKTHSRAARKGMCIRIHIYTCIHIYIYTYYTYILRERKTHSRAARKGPVRLTASTESHSSLLIPRTPRPCARDRERGSKRERERKRETERESERERKGGGYVGCAMYL